MTGQKFSLSIMCADQLRLGEALQDARRAGAHLIHADVMDGHFVHNITLGFDQLHKMADVSEIPVEAHLMVANLDVALPLVLASACTHVCFHIEATDAPIQYLRRIRESGKQAGIAVNPHTPVAFLKHMRDYLDYVLVMTVEPGFAGQKFLDNTAPKIAEIRSLIGPDKDITVDGNISLETARLCREQGANCYVLGTSVAYSGQQIDEARLQPFRAFLEQP